MDVRWGPQEPESGGEAQEESAPPPTVGFRVIIDGLVPIPEVTQVKSLEKTGQAFFGFKTILPARKFVLAPSTRKGKPVALPSHFRSE